MKNIGAWVENNSTTWKNIHPWRNLAISYILDWFSVTNLQLAILYIKLPDYEELRSPDNVGGASKQTNKISEIVHLNIDTYPIQHTEIKSFA